MPEVGRTNINKIRPQKFGVTVVDASYEHTKLWLQNNFLCDLGCTRVFGWSIHALRRRSTFKTHYLREKDVVFGESILKPCVGLTQR